MECVHLKNLSPGCLSQFNKTQIIHVRFESLLKDNMNSPTTNDFISKSTKLNIEVKHNESVFNIAKYESP